MARPNQVRLAEVVGALSLATDAGMGAPLEPPQGEIPPTGRSVTLPFVLIAHRRAGTDRAGRIAIYQDNLAFITQLGVLSEPAAA